MDSTLVFGILVQNSNSEALSAVLNAFRQIGRPAVVYTGDSLITLENSKPLLLPTEETFRSCVVADSSVEKMEGVVYVPHVLPEELNQIVEKYGGRHLVWIHSWYAGVNSLAPYLTLPAWTNIKLTNARGAFSSSLAEWVMFAAMYFEKDFLRIQRNQRERRWDPFTVGELRGKTMGFVGFGDIGQVIAQVAKNSFGMKILALRRDKQKQDDRSKQLADEIFCSSDPEERLEVFRQSDFVICSLPDTPSTRQFCGMKELSCLKPTSVFISIGRGVTVDEKVLEELLLSKAIKGAALDVFEEEPLPERSRLWDMKNVLLTSHNADRVPSYHASSGSVFFKNLEQYTTRGVGSLVTLVNKSVGY